MRTITVMSENNIIIMKEENCQEPRFMTNANVADPWT